MKRNDLIAINEQIKIKQAAAMSTLRSSTGKYLTRELEKEIDRTISDAIGSFEHLVSYDGMQKILGKLDVIKPNLNTHH